MCLKPFLGVFRFFAGSGSSDRHYYRILKNIFGIRPDNIEFYKLALIHRSASVFMPDGTAVNNERLEFLGDAVLETIVSDYLFKAFPSRNEGFLTHARSRIVSGTMLNELSVKIGLASYLVSKGVEGPLHKNLYGDAFEAVIGAMYLDKGFDFTNRVIIRQILDKHIDIDDIISTETDFKSRLIEWCQKNKHKISFITDHKEGSSLRNPVFKSVAMVDGMEIGYGFGQTKKEAEQRAAYSVSHAVTDRAGDNILDMFDSMMEQSKTK